MGLKILSELGIPLQVKVNALTPIEAALEIGNNQNCDSLCVSNAIPYGSYFPEPWWKAGFGDKSPLAKYNGGALSEDPLRNITLAWIEKIRRVGFSKPINGGGGILKPDHVDQYRDSGADSVFLGSIAVLRGWRVHKTIERAYKLFGDE